ncbi:reverse transcriptase domain-containing protein [Tanacetum coccineum]
MEDDFKPFIQPQRRLNPKVQDVVKNEIVKLLDSGLIYLISDSSWVSPTHVVPKKGGMTVVLNDNNELIPSCTITRWRVCIDYRFFQISIAPEDQEKTTFTCPYRTFAYQRMPFVLCNAPATFQRCMTAIFHDMVEDFREVFMNDFSIFDNSFDCCLANLDRMLARCEETNLVMNWEKCHFMVKEGIVLGHKISGQISRMGAKSSISLRIKLQQLVSERVSLDNIGFDIEIKDKRGAKNLAAGHLSRLENPNLGTFTKEEIADEFPDEHLMVLKTELNNDEPCIFKYAKDYVMRCDACQRSGNISSRSEMPQNNIQIYKERTKRWHDSRLRGDKNFKVEDMVLLFNSRFKMHPDKNEVSFKVNGQRLKKYHKGRIDAEQLRMTKVIKEEFEKIEDLNDEDVSLTYGTSIEVFNKEFNRMSGMDNVLFTYEVEVANIRCDSNKDDDSEQRASHEADDDIGYDPSNVAFTEWLGSKKFNYKTMDHYTKKALWNLRIEENDEVEATDEEFSDNEMKFAEVL